MIEENSIYCGDCFDLLNHVKQGSVDLILTDPPYGISDEAKITFTNGKPEFMRSKTKGEFEDQYSAPEMVELYQKLVQHADRILKPDGSLIIFYDRTMPHLLTPVYDVFIPRNKIIFVKSNPSPHMRKNNYRSGYEQCAWFSRAKYKINFVSQKGMVNVFYGSTSKHYTSHPTEKYGWMIEPLIRRHSNEGDLILDPFVGSGRTCVEAKKLGRRYIGIDIKPEYCEMAIKWLEKIPESVVDYFAHKQSLSNVEKWFEW